LPTVSLITGRRINAKGASFFRKAWSAIVRREPDKAAVVVHDPAASKPHDLDDPFFDRKVQERIGAAIAKAARKK
jgi:hypothetical protein